MDSSTIHLHQENHFDKTRLIILMIPCLVFLLVLLVFISLTSYNSASHTATTSNYEDVLGTNK